MLLNEEGDEYLFPTNINRPIVCISILFNAFPFYTFSSEMKINGKWLRKCILPEGTFFNLNVETEKKARKDKWNCCVWSVWPFRMTSTQNHTFMHFQELLCLIHLVIWFNVIFMVLILCFMILYFNVYDDLIFPDKRQWKYQLHSTIHILNAFLIRATHKHTYARINAYVLCIIESHQASEHQYDLMCMDVEKWKHIIKC